MDATSGSDGICFEGLYDKCNVFLKKNKNTNNVYIVLLIMYMIQMHLAVDIDGSHVVATENDELMDAVSGFDGMLSGCGVAVRDTAFNIRR